MILQNSEYIARFSVRGAELLSFENKKSGKNFIWNANPDFWAKTSPILFPFVGALKDNTFIFEEQKYNLPRHGFARELDFSIASHTENEIVFVLETLHKEYPFQYQLKVIYTLLENGLNCTYEVFNPTVNETLWYSIGAHPAFAIETSKDIAYSDYYLEFNKDAYLDISSIANHGLIAEETNRIELNQNRLPLSYSLFYKDALVIKNLKSDSIHIKNKQSNLAINFSFFNLPYFGIWAAKNADFVCLEPWAGIADSIYHNQILENKEGIQKLDSQQSQKHFWQFTIELK